MVDLVRQSAASLQQALRSVADWQASAQRAAEGVQTTLEALHAGGEVAAERMEVVAGVVARAQPAIDEVERLLVSVSDRMAVLDERASAAWSQATLEVNASMAEVVKSLQSAPPARRQEEFAAPASSISPAPGRDPELTALLRRVAAAMENRDTPSRTLALAQGAGIVGAAAVFVGAYGIYLLLGQLFEGAARYFGS